MREGMLTCYAGMLIAAIIFLVMLLRLSYINSHGSGKTQEDSWWSRREGESEDEWWERMGF